MTQQFLLDETNNSALSEVTQLITEQNTSPESGGQMWARESGNWGNTPVATILSPQDG